MEENQAPKPPPKEFWDDYFWALKHYGEITEDHPECWVAIVNKVVIATGASWGEARDIAFRKSKREEFPILFAESKRRIY